MLESGGGLLSNEKRVNEDSLRLTQRWVQTNLRYTPHAPLFPASPVLTEIPIKRLMQHLASSDRKEFCFGVGGFLNVEFNCRKTIKRFGNWLEYTA